MPRREFNLSDLNGVNGFAINGIAPGDQSGASVASAGDINGDGVDDIIIGAPSANYNALPSHAGESYIIFGHNKTWLSRFELSSLNGSNGVILAGIHQGGLSGYPVSGGGDINDDGVDDVIIGAFYVDLVAKIHVGESYLIFGHNGSWPSVISFSSLNGSNGLTISGVNAGDTLGRSVSNLGDINGDGIDDVILGAPNARPYNFSSAGETYIIFGHNYSWPEHFDLFLLNGTNGFVLQGFAASCWSGVSATAVGDVNNDGIDDMIVGAHGANPNDIPFAGETYLVFGRLGVWPAQISLSSLNGSNGVTINGIISGSGSGYSVSFAGDVNGDGFSDILIGTYNANRYGKRGLGETYLLFGHGGVWPAQINLSSLLGHDGVVINGIDAEDRSGLMVSSADDINADGFSDILIGAHLADPNGQDAAGETYLIFGHAGVWPPQMNLSLLDGSNGIIINGVSAGDSSGYSLASAGDINGDGFNDLIIGAYLSDFADRLDTGQSYVIFGGAEQFNANQIIIESGQMIRLNQSNLAVEPIIGNRTFTIINASHINFYSTYDISFPIFNFTQQQIIDGEILAIQDGSESTPSYTVSAEGITRLFSDVHPDQANISFSVAQPKITAPNREFNLSYLDGLNGFSINGSSAGDFFGISVSSAGDANGDGFSDLLIGANQASPDGRIAAGKSYLIFGHNGTWPSSLAVVSLNASTMTAINGISSGDESGTSVAAIGDFNGDGLSDVMIGAYHASPGNRTHAGQNYILLGRSVWPHALELSSLDDDVSSFTISGSSPGDAIGFFVRSAGDVNGDGYKDIIMGSHYADPGGRFDAGRVYLVFGHTDIRSPTFSLSTLDGNDGVIINGISPGDYCGYSVASAGDINHDGFDDILIGAFHGSPNGRNMAGQTYVIFGRRVWQSIIELSSLDGLSGVTINGIKAGDFSGVSVSSAGDCNADGIDDILIGANLADPADRTSAGETYVIFGRLSWPSILELSSLDGISGFKINGINVNDQSAGITSLGDINGDGIDDVAIAASVASFNGYSYVGRTYILFGHQEAWPAVVELHSLNGINGLMINGIAENDQSGRSISSAGDVNADGYPDVIIGAYSASPSNQTQAGQAYVIFGGPEHFNANQLSIEQGGTLVLNTSNIEVEPNIAFRVINVTDVRHGYFSFISNQTIEIDTFTQGQINNGEIVFIHDGSDQAPSYLLSAQGITRLFSNVHPLAGNVSFVLSTSTLTTATTLTSTNTETSTILTSSTDLSTVSILANASLFPSIDTIPSSIAKITSVGMRLFTTTLPLILDSGTTPEDNSEGAGDNTLAIIIGTLSACLFLLLFWITCNRYKNKKRNELENVANQSNGMQSRTVNMTLNPVYEKSKNLTDSEAQADRASVLQSGYLDVSGGNETLTTESIADQELSSGEYLEPVTISGVNSLAIESQTYLTPVKLNQNYNTPRSLDIFSERYEVPILAEQHSINDYEKFEDKSRMDSQKIGNNAYRLFESNSDSEFRRELSEQDYEYIQHVQ